MTPEEALDRGKRAAQLRQVYRTLHAGARGADRRFHIEDVYEAILTSTKAEYSAAEDTWRLSGGRDLDGDELTPVLAIGEHEVRLVTAF